MYVVRSVGVISVAKIMGCTYAAPRAYFCAIRAHRRIDGRSRRSRQLRQSQ